MQLCECGGRNSERKRKRNMMMLCLVFLVIFIAFFIKFLTADGNYSIWIHVWIWIWIMKRALKFRNFCYQGTSHYCQKGKWNAKKLKIRLILPFVFWNIIKKLVTQKRAKVWSTNYCLGVDLSVLVYFPIFLYLFITLILNAGCLGYRG